MKIERVTVPFQIKSMTEDAEYFNFEGYLSTFGNEDFGGDIVHKGAFEKTIREWKSKGQMVPTLWQHNMHEPVGVFTEMFEDSYGLFVKGRLPKADTFVSGRVIPQMKAGSIKAMSIGYRAEKFDFDEAGWTRNLKEIQLFEGSLVTMPMNANAVITGMKSLTPFQNLPFAPRETVWDAETAFLRVMEAGKGGEAHLWNTETGSKFLVADMVDGKLTIVPKGLFAAAAQIQLGDSELVSEETQAVKYSISRYYKEMGAENPFAEKDCVRIDFIEQLSPRELEKLLRKGVSFSQSEAKRIVKLIGDSQREVVQKPDRDDHKDLSNLLETLKSF